MKHFRLITTAVALSVAAAASSVIGAAELDPKAITIKLPDQNSLEAQCRRHQRNRRAGG